MGRTALIWAGALGTVAVILGAFAAHSLPKHLSPEQVNSFETGVDFQLYHALALLAVAALSQQFPASWWKWVLRMFTIGTLCFSGSIYLLALQPITGLEVGGFLWPVTPLGGTLLIIGWAIITVQAVRLAKG